MRRAILTLMAAAAVVFALRITAESTVEWGHAHGMSTAVGLCLVGLLEVVNVMCTWTWITDPRTHVRVEAALGVGVASIASGTFAAAKYGPTGVLAAAGVLGAVHFVSRQWLTQEVPPQVDVTATSPVTSRVTEQEPQVETLPEPFQEPSPNPPATLTDDDRIAELREWARRDGKMPGRDRVKARFGVGSGTANELRAAAERPAIRAVT